MLVRACENSLGKTEVFNGVCPRVPVSGRRGTHGKHIRTQTRLAGESSGLEKLTHNSRNLVAPPPAGNRISIRPLSYHVSGAETVRGKNPKSDDPFGIGLPNPQTGVWSACVLPRSRKPIRHCHEWPRIGSGCAGREQARQPPSLGAKTASGRNCVGARMGSAALMWL